jgi:serine protease Do
MMNWKQVGRLAIAPVLALGMAASLTAYHTAKPVVAKAAAVAPSATPLDDNSVSPLLALDQAMETLAARVTPAIVNVAVTSKSKGDEQAQG